ncbi:hypothetical protein [Pandoraea apista]|uniref:Uncharacterized protein n=1 Tax=Pandoraea apista TaxID=93218 RepID=A0ABX9ZVM0_9BURK|nr:hypothetical protein [Pandoraea apista]AJE99576.1 hypothetical protein SG18_17665 [Pandoraea apista]AKH73696.1 hypothetical protein XM39_17860 [Pandoraea apista]AKI62245.1 hypothetical protein AA956_11175 [Pandoraea apista]ALS64027.1 hypothetical protein AT395_02505 [Pandoraea apista]AVF40551.1 hypothetical protein AL486_13130 [Pandoraea apista]
MTAILFGSGIKKAAERVGGATERVTAQPKLPEISIGRGDDNVVTAVSAKRPGFVEIHRRIAR